MDTKRLPWHISPSLQLHRLQAVAQTFVTVWTELSDKHEPAKGDSAWSIGCRGYSRICHEISRLAMGEHRDWLRVIKDTGLSYLFAIGGVPFKFLRGDPARTVVRHRVCRDAERQARQGVLFLVPQPEFQSLLPRLIIETDDLWRVKAVTLVWVDDRGISHHPYQIPLEVAAIKPPSAAQLPPPRLGFPKKHDIKSRETKE